MTEKVSKRQLNAERTVELIGDLIAFRSILYKLGFDEQADNEKLFVEMANEVGFRAPNGAELTYMGYRQMFKRADEKTLRDIIADVTSDKIVANFAV